ncbi:MAG: flagellar assembly protein T N-terminal domain-containing protein [Geobacteraceae bacterium]|nr:flagellar assembly protein T N-terminal domain-containing protein [Geobacteraceae bacterium]
MTSTTVQSAVSVVAGWCCVLFLVLVLSQGLAAADQSGGSVEVEGYASIVGGRKDLAREAALQNAFRRAVEQVVGVALESKTVVKDAELLNDKIFSKSRGFIKTYRVVGEKVEADAYRLSIFASVSRHKLEQGLDDAGLLIRKMGKPRIAVVVMEQNGYGDAMPGGVVENSLLASLGKRGYALVDRQAMLAVEHEKVKQPGDHAAAVVRAAAAGGAEIVIVGQAVARSTSALSGTNLRPVQVTVTCRAIEVDSGELLATVTATQQALHVNPATATAEAFEKAAAELSVGLQRQMLAAWTKRLTGLRTLHMTVSMIPHADIRRLQDALKEQVGQIEEVHDRGYRDQQLRLDLEVTGGFKDVIDGLATLRPEGASLKIIGYSAGQLKAEWQSCPTEGGHTR